MRISLLINRENFFDILKKSLLNYIVELKKEKGSNKKYFVNNYLNFISTASNSSKHFKVLTNEYANSQVIWKKWIQKNYVHLAVKPKLRSIFSQSKIILPSFFSDYIILGGNHRLRLFSDQIEGSLVILKNDEREQYVRNDNLVREELKLSYAPKIISKGKCWFIETLFYGIPLNRLQTISKIKKFRDKIWETHLNELITNSLFDITIQEYNTIVFTNIKSVLAKSNNQNYIVNCEQDIEITLAMLFQSIPDKTQIKMSWSHGDFQEANMLIQQSEFKVIDWEAADKRYYLYDQFVLYGKIREGNSIKVAFEKLYLNFPKLKNSEFFAIPLLLIEELRFSINEEFSKNFYECGKKTVQLCREIQNFFNERKSSFN